jgi:hypothetical protein
MDHSRFSSDSFKGRSVKPEGKEGMVIKVMYFGFAADCIRLKTQTTVQAGRLASSNPA